MSETSTTTLLFTFLFLQLATTTISTDVRRDYSSKQHPSEAHVASGSSARDFRPTDHEPIPEINGAPRFTINPGRPRKALTEIASGFAKAAESDDKQTPEKKAPPQFRIQPMKPGKATGSDDKPVSEKKAPPRFRTQPVKPRKIEHLAKKPIPSRPQRKTPVPPSAHFHKITAPTKPHRHLIRRAQPPNPQIPSPTTAAGKRWCVAKADTSDQVLHANIDYACKKGVDCKPIQKGGDCFNSSSLRSRASFVMNAFYNINGRMDFNCYFGQSGVLTSTNPSYGKCIFL